MREYPVIASSGMDGYVCVRASLGPLNLYSRMPLILVSPLPTERSPADCIGDHFRACVPPQ